MATGGLRRRLDSGAGLSGFIAALDKARTEPPECANWNEHWNRLHDMRSGALAMRDHLCREARIKASLSGAFSFDAVNQLTEKEMYAMQQVWTVEQAGERLFGGEKSYNLDAAGAMALGQKMYALAKLRRQLRRHRALLARAVRGTPQGAVDTAVARFEAAMKTAIVPSFLMGVPDTWAGVIVGDDDCAQACNDVGALYDAGMRAFDQTIGTTILLTACEVAALFDNLVLAKVNSGRGDATVTAAWAVGYCAAVGLSSPQMRRLNSDEPHLKYTPGVAGASKFSDAARSLMVIGACSGNN